MKASELQHVGMALRLSAFDSSVSYIYKNTINSAEQFQQEQVSVPCCSSTVCSNSYYV